MFVCTAGDSLSAGGQPVQIFLLEAMAQLAGGLVFPEAGRPGYLSAIDSCTVQREIRVGDVVRIRVDLEAQLGGVYRFQGTGSVDGVELVRGRFCLAEPDGSQW
jgi:3-hydroxymyristoyl/3-hydroxydecanoyl-(acyl carrier protein) dehydratase